jgi:hypothetical protein
MPTFIDESGDTGTKAGSTPYFRLAAVFFASADDLKEHSLRISRLRQTKRLPQDFEFHFAALGHPLRMEYFTAIVESEFSFVVTSYNKFSTVRDKKNKQMIYEDSIRRIASHLHLGYSAAETVIASPGGLKDIVVYDDCDDPRFERAIKDGFKHLRASRPCGKRFVRHVRPGKSHSDAGLQLADMICGAAGKHLEGASDYFNLVCKKAWSIDCLQ